MLLIHSGKVLLFLLKQWRIDHLLGDNVQSSGLPDSTHHLWEVAQESLNAQLKLIDNFKGEAAHMTLPDRIIE